MLRSTRWAFAAALLGLAYVVLRSATHPSEPPPSMSPRPDTPAHAQSTTPNNLAADQAAHDQHEITLEYSSS